ncbi:type II toxin-antitoxin system VapC family toxin [Paracraurococcus lichenis]|uniref:Type II toxin-antitoxin system VapC family toxin n=1 Tax=Paracraurococcus lichenis TaxID=3064888 RepID=A0ABT9DSQ0_9PROT|nr:type II toxin-antitoxin system VapC family toxin [Paracraurococcus sp. LOR1-02]MDO9706928.1 type II toxin-antitoxin system VapC family toxin [Paracraurococcus sp. LOR1-02]
MSEAGSGYLADACALIVFHAAGGRGMSAAALAAMRGGDVAVSAITVWEITRKVALGKLPLLPAVQGSFAGWLRDAGYTLLPLDVLAAEQANALPPHHADPMDRMLLATARLTGRIILTEDAAFRAYGLPLLW